MKTRGISSRHENGKCQVNKARGESGNSQVSKGPVEQVATDSVPLGDLIFIKLRSGSWWPAQVVDVNTISESIKPSKRNEGELLVRLYGSYTYSYVDPIKCHSEFETILKHNNGSYRNILQQALEQDLPSTKSSRSKGSSSKTKGTSSKNASSKRKSDQKDEKQNKVKSQKQNKMSNNDVPASQNPETASLGKSQELSARRVRVMESLGLIAPPGSPFHKDGHISNQSS